MPPPRRKLQATFQETLQPPSQLGPNQTIARIDRAAGNNLYQVQLSSQTSTKNRSLPPNPDHTTSLVELPSRFRSQIWLKRGGFVLIEMKAETGERGNKIRGEIVNVVGDEKAWRKELKGKGWPEDFCEKRRPRGAIDDADGPNGLSEEMIQAGDVPPSEEETGG